MRPWYTGITVLNQIFYIFYFLFFIVTIIMNFDPTTHLLFMFFLYTCLPA